MRRIAIVGAAHPHVEYLLDELGRRDRRDFSLVGVWDPVPARAERCAAAGGTRRFDGREQLLAEGPDVVMVAGVYGERADDAIAALASGAHVLADKPLCVTVEQAARVRAAARDADRSVCLLLEKRGYPETLAARDLLARGELGEIVGIASSGPHKLNRGTRPEWFLDPARYGGILADLSVHDLDAALLFAPTDRATVRGAVAAPLDGAEGFLRYGVAALTTPTAVITAEVSWLTPQASDVHGDYRMRLVGTEGTAEIFWARGRVEATTARRGTRTLELPPGRRPAQDALDAFAAGAEPGGGAAAGTEESLAATELAVLAQESADRGGVALEWVAASHEQEKREKR